MGKLTDTTSPGRVARVIALMVGTVGLLVLAGWLINSSAMRSVVTGWVPMVPNTAIAFLLSALVLWIRAGGEAAARRAVWGADVVAVLVAAYGGVALVEYAHGSNLPHNQWLLQFFQDVPPLGASGRPALMSATAFAVVGLSLLRVPWWVRHAGGLTVAMIAYLGLLGYLFDVSAFYALLPSLPMSVLTATTFLALAVGVLALQPYHGLAALAASPGSGGLLVRRALLPALAVPLVLGGLGIVIERLTALPDVIGFGIRVLVMSAFLLALLWRSATDLERLDAHRREALEALRRMEAELRRSEERWRTAMQAAPDGILLTDGRGRILYANRVAEAMFGYAPGTLADVWVDTLVPERFFVRHLELRRQFAEDPRFQIMTFDDYVGVRRDGSQFPFEVSLGPVETPDGFIVSAGLRDLTERRRMLEETLRQRVAAEQAREMMQLKDHLLSSISHEMKTPLSVITGYAELLEDQHAGDPLLAGIQDGVRRLTDHINRILDVSALVSRRLQLYPALVSLGELITELKGEFETRFAAAGLKLVVDVAPEVPPVWGDSRRLTQLIVELLTNARQHSGPGGTVTLRLATENGLALLEVSDTGPGIPVEKQALIWEAFSQLDMGDAIGKGGLGLGLAIVKGIADLHGATVTVESSVGRGSRFRVHFPDATTRRPADPAPSTHTGLPRT